MAFLVFFNTRIVLSTFISPFDRINSFARHGLINENSSERPRCRHQKNDSIQDYNVFDRRDVRDDSAME
jgi:hypothetical protein